MALNEVRYGKGPMDGVGGRVNSIVFRAAKSERISVNTPEEFANAANLLIPWISSIYLSIFTNIRYVSGTTTSS